MKSSIFTSVFISILLFQPLLKAQTTYTVAVSNENWTNANTWSPPGVPGPNDHVIIDKKSVIISGQHTIGGFTIIDGNINFTGINPTLTVTDTSIWYDGEIDGGNSAGGGNDVNSKFIIGPTATLIIDTDATPQTHRFYEGITVLNLGTITYKGSTGLGIRGLSVIRNEGLVDIQSDADFGGESFSGGTFINIGTFRKSGGTDITSFNTWWNFQNIGGFIDAQSGSIHFTCLGTFDGGKFIAANNAAIDFRTSTMIFKGTLSGSPDGAVRLSGSTINIDSSGAALDFQGSGFQFSKGKITGGGTLTITEGSLLRFVADPVDQISFQNLEGETTLLNLGTIRQESNTTIGIRGPSTVDNRALFEIITDADFSGGSGSGGTFLNSGTFRKSGGNDISLFDGWWNFQNQGGTIDAQNGSIHFTCLGTFDGGNFIAANNAAIDFRGSTIIFKGTLSGSPAGAVRLSGSIINIDSSGAALDFQGSGFQFSKGKISGGGTLTITEGSLLRFVADSVDQISLQRLEGETTLLNLGTIRQESNTTIGIRGPSFIDNRSLFEVITDADFSGGSGSGGTFLNSGTFRKSGGNDISSFDGWWKFFNQSGGIFDAASGVLNMSHFESAENSVVKGNAVIDFPGSFTINGIASPGDSPGTLTFIGNYNSSSTGVLDIELGGLTAGSMHDQLNVTGNAGLDGTIKINLINGFIPAAGDSFVVLTTTGSISDSFINIDAQTGLYLTIKANSNNVTVLVDSVGTITSVEDESDGEIVLSYELSQNYPNPFNPATSIQYSVGSKQYAVGSRQFVSLKIYDVLGNEIATLVNEDKPAGTYEVEWNAQGLTSGIYFYKIEAGSFIETKKMILMK